MKSIDPNSPEFKRALREVLANKNRVHVIPYAGRWSVSREGTRRASKVFIRRQEAIDWARSAARKTSGELIVHNREGRIQEHYSYRAGSGSRRTKG